MEGSFPTDGLEGIKFCAYEVFCEALDEIVLPAFSGSTFRGAFGAALRRVSCLPVRRRDCSACTVAEGCPYFFTFESQHLDTPAGLRNFPHPFVLEPPSARQIRAGEEFSFRFVVVGEALRYFPFFVCAFVRMGEAGVGRGRGRFRLVRIDSLSDGLCVYDGRDGRLSGCGEPVLLSPIELRGAVRIDFVTPARIKRGGRYVYSPDFAVLVRSAMRRLSLLAEGYCGFKLSLPFDELLSFASRVSVRALETRKVVVQRYSSRQGRHVPLYGAVGFAEYEGKLSPFGSLLAAAEWLHIGGATSFGFGKIKVSPV